MVDSDQLGSATLHTATPALELLFAERFTVANTSGQVTKATLRVSAGSTST